LLDDHGAWASRGLRYCMHSRVTGLSGDWRAPRSGNCRTTIGEPAASEESRDRIDPASEVQSDPADLLASLRAVRLISKGEQADWLPGDIRRMRLAPADLQFNHEWPQREAEDAEAFAAWSEAFQAVSGTAERLPGVGGVHHRQHGVRVSPWESFQRDCSL
jgi:hypothetical protein